MRFAIARRAARAPRDLVGRVVLDLTPRIPRRAAHDRAELAGLVVAEPERHPEAVAQRRRQQPGARRRADERERRQVERQRSRRGALAEDDVEPEVLERRVEDLLDGAVEAVDLVDEEHVARLERGQDRGHVPFRSSAGPATVRIPTPSSSRMIWASVVLPSPGGPASRTWSSASPRPLAASSAIPSCSLMRSWPTKSSSRRGRSERSSSSSSGSEHRRQERGSRRQPPRSACAHALLGRAAPDRRRPARCSASSDRVAELDERVARDEVRRRRRRRPRRRGSSTASDDLLLQLEHDPLGRLLPDPGDRLEARVSPSAIARRSSAAGEPETTASATFGPIPLTVSSCMNSSRSDGVGEPVELQRVLAHVEIGLDGDLVPRPRRAAARPASPRRGSRRR